MIPILAHGALGWWDELIFLGVVVAFVTMMALSWMRSRNVQPQFDDAPEQPQNDASGSGDRFRLD